MEGAEGVEGAEGGEAKLGEHSCACDGANAVIDPTYLIMLGLCWMVGVVIPRPPPVECGVVEGVGEMGISPEASFKNDLC